MSKKAMRLLFVDDHASVREAISNLIAKSFPRTTVLEAGTYEDAVKILGREGAVDLILLDLDLPGLNGLEAVKTLHQSHTEIPIVIFSGLKSVSPNALYEHGAMGFIPKSYGLDTMWDAMKIVIGGGLYRPSTINSDNVTKLARSREETVEYLRSELKLTEIEINIFFMLAKGDRLKTIMAKLKIQSESTLKSYNTKIYAAFKVRRRAELLNKVYELGLSIDLFESQ